MQQPGDQPGNVLRAFRAGNANNWNSAIVAQAHMVWRLGGLRKEVVANRTSNRARSALCGLEVHQQPRAGIDLDNGATLFV